MATRTERLKLALESALAGRLSSLTVALGEVTVVVKAADWLGVAERLRDHPELAFEEAMDLCGVDYSAYGDGAWEGPRYAVVVHLLSVTHNWRLRLRTFAPDDAFPVIDSLTALWPGLNWFEREAFDLFGIMFSGHADLRRILTDYGFVGHPFRKDFPLSGHVEVRYDPSRGRVVNEPVSIVPRVTVPKVIRKERTPGAPGTGGNA
jgi:NADH-quinone oxidoreductase subunit C